MEKFPHLVGFEGLVQYDSAGYFRIGVRHIASGEYAFSSWTGHLGVATVVFRRCIWFAVTEAHKSNHVPDVVHAIGPSIETKVLRPGGSLWSYGDNWPT